MATTSEAVNNAASPAARSRLSPKLVFGVAGLVAALAIAVTLFTVLRGGLVQAAPAVAPEVKPIFVNVEPVTVNLQSEARPKYLHLGLTLKLSDEHAQARIVESMPELRSRLFLLLSNRDPATLSSAADKSKLADEIKIALNRPLAAGQPPYGISAVAFNAFVVQ